MWNHQENLRSLSAYDERLKRLFDVVVSGIGLLILAPAIAAIAIGIQRDSRGPVLYRGVRIGRDGRPFRIYKFRTMVADADRVGGPSTADDDPRITRLGRWLRTSKLDELPQLINVLVGEMSIVGPRPEVPEYVSLLTEEERPIISVRPGMTDWASIWDIDEGAVLAGSADPERTYLEQIRPEKIRLQLEYVRRRSLWVDMQIIGQTVTTVLRGWVRRGTGGRSHP